MKRQKILEWLVAGILWVQFVLNPSLSEFWFARVFPNYLNFATLKGLIAYIYVRYAWH